MVSEITPSVPEELVPPLVEKSVFIDVASKDLAGHHSGPTHVAAGSQPGITLSARQRGQLRIQERNLPRFFF